MLREEWTRRERKWVPLTLSLFTQFISLLVLHSQSTIEDSNCCLTCWNSSLYFSDELGSGRGSLPCSDETTLGWRLPARPARQWTHSLRLWRVNLLYWLRMIWRDLAINAWMFFFCRKRAQGRPKSQTKTQEGNKKNAANRKHQRNPKAAENTIMEASPIANHQPPSDHEGAEKPSTPAGDQAERFPGHLPAHSQDSPESPRTR